MDQNVKKYKFYCLDAQHCTFFTTSDYTTECRHIIFTINKHPYYVSVAHQMGWYSGMYTFDRCVCWRKWGDLPVNNVGMYFTWLGL